MADQCARCTQWNKSTRICNESASPFFKKQTLDETACDYIEKGNPFKGVNCPSCGRFMRHAENFTYVIEHVHNVFDLEKEYTHTHGVECEIWVCVCGNFENIEIANEHEEPKPLGYLLNTSENPEPW